MKYTFSMNFLDCLRLLLRRRLTKCSKQWFGWYKVSTFNVQANPIFHFSDPSLYHWQLVCFGWMSSLIYLKRCEIQSWVNSLHILWLPLDEIVKIIIYYISCHSYTCHCTEISIGSFVQTYDCIMDRWMWYILDKSGDYKVHYRFRDVTKMLNWIYPTQW